MDKADCIKFIDYQFKRLGMYSESEVVMRNEFIRQLSTSRAWIVLSNVVSYVNSKVNDYYDEM